MPLTVPAQSRVVYAEVNTPPTGSNDSLDPDAFYDIDQNEITGDALTRALTELGLSYDDAGRFTALKDITLAVFLSLVAESSLTADASVSINQPDYIYNPVLNIPSSNSIGYTTIDRTFVMRAGDIWRVSQVCDNPGDTPLTYAALSIIRLI